jgi:hypothetical protein
MSEDPLSKVLSHLKPRSYVAGGFDLGGDWSIRYDAHDGVKYFALVSGGCWLLVDGESDAVRLEAGDCILLPRGRRFVVARDAIYEPTHLDELFASDWRGGVATLNGGGDTMMLGGIRLLRRPY